MSFSRHSSSFLLHEHDPTMNARIVHAVNVSNKKELAQLKHKSESLAGSNNVSMHIHRQEEKELVKHLVKLQQEKLRRHPEIHRPTSRRSHSHSVDKSSEKLIKSLDFGHSGSATHQHAPRGASGSNASLLQQYVQDPIYQPVGYGHGSQEYVGVPEDIAHGRRRGESEGKLGNHATTSHTAISHPAIANALPSRHLITSDPHRQQSKTTAFLEPQHKSSISNNMPSGNKPTADDKSEGRKGSPVLSAEPLNLKDGHKTHQKTTKGHPKHMQHHAPKQRTVAFDVKSSPASSPSTKGDLELGQVAPDENAEKAQQPAAAGTSPSAHAVERIPSVTDSHHDPHDLHHHQDSVTRAIIEEEHHKVDSIIDSFRKSFPVKQELDWQKKHPRPSPSSQRGPFKAHTPPHEVSSQDSSVGSYYRDDHHHHHHDHGSYLMDHSATHVGGSHANVSRHRDHHVGSHANVSHHHDHMHPHHGHAGSRGSFSNVTHHHNTHHADNSHYNVSHGHHGHGSPRNSHANVSHGHHGHGSPRTSHANVGHHHAAGSQASLGRQAVENLSIYNLPKEAVEDFRNLMMQASHSSQHPSTRDQHKLPHQRNVGIPHSHPPKSQFRKSRQKLLALHLLANKQRQLAAAKQGPPFDPVDTLMCRYLRLSALNVETLVDMCNESGVQIGIHPHMSIDDLSNMVFQPDKHPVTESESKEGHDDIKEETSKVDVVKSDDNQAKPVTSDSSRIEHVEKEH